MAAGSPRPEMTYTGAKLPAPDAPAADTWVGEDDPWLELLAAEEHERPLGFLGAILASALLGALVWTLVGLALYRLIA